MESIYDLIIKPRPTNGHRRIKPIIADKKVTDPSLSHAELGSKVMALSSQTNVTSRLERRCLIVTNKQVSPDEQAAFTNTIMKDDLSIKKVVFKHVQESPHFMEITTLEVNCRSKTTSIFNALQSALDEALASGHPVIDVSLGIALGIISNSEGETILSTMAQSLAELNESFLEGKNENS
jgi:hypothetical protein